MSTPANSSSLSSGLLEQLQAQLTGPLFTEVSSQLTNFQNKLQYAELKIQILEQHLRLRRIAKYGPGSETLSNLQLQLLEEEPGVSTEEVVCPIFCTSEIVSVAQRTS